MPCSDSGPSYEQQERAQRWHQVMTRLSCDYCKWLEKNVGKVPEYAREWWEEHQELDRQRKAETARLIEERKAKRIALAKLSPADRKALGL